jgi:hypothetical protein
MYTLFGGSSQGVVLHFRTTFRGNDRWIDTLHWWQGSDAVADPSTVLGPLSGVRLGTSLGAANTGCGLSPTETGGPTRTATCPRMPPAWNRPNGEPCRPIRRFDTWRLSTGPRSKEAGRAGPLRLGCRSDTAAIPGRASPSAASLCSAWDRPTQTARQVPLVKRPVRRRAATG